VPAAVFPDIGVKSRLTGQSVFFALPGSPIGVGSFESRVGRAVSGGGIRCVAVWLFIGGVKGESLVLFGIDRDSADRIRGAFLR